MERIRVAAALVMDGDRILVSSRPAGKSLAGMWEFPGGKLEPGESYAAALRRELDEELNLEVEVFDVVYSLTLPGERELEILFIRCFPVDPATLAARENQQWRWVSRDELDRVDFLPADRPVADFLQYGYNKRPQADVCFI